MPRNLPPTAVRETILSDFDSLIRALESHPSWPASGSTAPPHPSLYHVWDFVNRSRYIMTEIDNIRDGKPLRHPEQVPSNGGAASGEQAAAQSFDDVCSRAVMMDSMVQNPQMLTMLGLSQIDFGQDMRKASKAASDALVNAS
ncbi:hypothetical protein HJFPF1_03632 [Paramyrothecium foliicola]|nr:hypothetical protein HJFPF1_03632 [Paramyrothecium foliicola]